MKNNKGAVSVLLLLILAVMITVIGAAGDVCSLAVAKAYAQRMNYMACKSVLAEYNSYLFEDYGLLGFEGGKDEIKDLVKNYNSMMKRVDDSALHFRRCVHHLPVYLRIRLLRSCKRLAHEVWIYRLSYPLLHSLKNFPYCSFFI